MTIGIEGCNALQEAVQQSHSHNINIGIDYESQWEYQLPLVERLAQNAMTSLDGFDAYIGTYLRAAHELERRLSVTVKSYKSTSQVELEAISPSLRSVLSQHIRECDEQLTRPWECLVDILLDSPVYQQEVLHGSLNNIASGLAFFENKRNEDHEPLYEELRQCLLSDRSYEVKRQFILAFLLRPVYTTNTPTDFTPSYTSKFGYTVLKAMMRVEALHPTEFHEDLVHLFDPPQAAA